MQAAQPSSPSSSSGDGNTDSKNNPFANNPFDGEDNPFHLDTLWMEETSPTEESFEGSFAAEKSEVPNPTTPHPEVPLANPSNPEILAAATEIQAEPTEVQPPENADSFEVIYGVSELNIESTILDDLYVEAASESEDFKFLIETVPEEPTGANSGLLEEQAFDTLISLFDESVKAEQQDLSKDEFAAIDEFVHRPVTTQIVEMDSGITPSGIPEDEIAMLEAMLSAPPQGMPPLPNSAIAIPGMKRNESKPKLEVSKAESGDRASIKSDAKLDSKLDTKSYGTHVIRVELTRLEKLGNLVGELVTQENSTLLQIQQLQNAINSISQRLERFERFVGELHDWADQSQKDRAKVGNSTLSSTTGADFDPLLMDVYSNFHTLSQSAIEEVARQGETIRELLSMSQSIQTIHQQKQQTLKEVRNDLMWIRMVPIGEILQRFPRMIRDMCVRYGKQVNVKLIGSDTLIDKYLSEKLLDPMVHLVRNAFDHGIEMPEDRQAAHKSTQAKIEIRAFHRGNQTYVEVKDDGRGIDGDRIRRKLVHLGWKTLEEAKKIPNHQLYDYLFAPGFSTAEQVTEVSGRGVGLDVVKEQVKLLKGSINIQSEIGKGTTFTLRFPLTMTVVDLLVFSIQNVRMAVPVDSLIGIISAAPTQIETLMGQAFYHDNGQSIPLYATDKLLQHYPILNNACDIFPAIPLSTEGKVSLLLITAATGTIALRVDHILQQQELTIKPFGLAIAPPDYLQGCTILGDGSVVPVLNGHALNVETKTNVPRSVILDESDSLDQQLGEQEPTEQQPMSFREANQKLREELQNSQKLMQAELQAATTPEKDESGYTQPFEPRSVIIDAQSILVIDDSLVVRQALTFTLEQAGYRVLQARDGQDAIAQLRRDASVRAIFCDIEMPRMNGFEFLKASRDMLGEFCPPTIMLTSRSSDKHREMARELGAINYLTKPYLEQTLLNLLEQHLVASQTY
jgi:two-component system, chemotaxis family, sensor histidine kinase and response regulator PixL